MKIPKPKKKYSREKTRKKLYEKAWDLFSIYIRKRDKGVCFTCGDKRDWKKQNAGHFIPQSAYSDTMFDKFNVHCQCVRCNKWKHGNLGVYALKLVEKYGKKKLKELIKRRDKIKKWKIAELENIITLYKT